MMKFMEAVQPKPSRRQFMLGAVATGAGFVVGYYVPGGTALAAAPAKPEAPKIPNPFAGYVQIGTDNKVTVFSAHMDMGQGCYNGTATLVAEELDADWSHIDVVGGWGNPKLYGNLITGGAAQMTGGSSAMFSSFDRYRQAGAAARAMLVAAAADSWKVPAGEITVKQGVVSHASGKRATFGELAAKAATMPVPDKVSVKPANAWTLIGNAKLPRYDSAPKVNGKQDFTLDVKLPGMLTAVMIHPPRFGATVKSFDGAAAKKIKGVVDVVAIPRGVAIVAEKMWIALKARDAVKVEWDESKAEKRGSNELMAEYRKLAEKPGVATARNDGDVEKAFAGAAKVLETRFEFPYLAHAALEPLNAVARFNSDGTLEIWGGHQMPDLYQFIASKVAGITPDKVKLHVMKTGGGFGRRATPDGEIIVEAVAVAKAIGGKAPVKVQWTRENDMRGGRYRPMYVHKLKAGLDANGKLVAWYNHIVGQSIMAGTPFEAGLVKNGVDLMSVEGSANIPYAIPNLRVDLTSTSVGVPVLWWRAVGSTHTAYAVEAFIDELAEAAGKDPVEFRLAMLEKHPRHAGVLKLVAEKAGWGKALAPGRFRGIAVAEAFHTFVAQVAEISLGKDGLKVERLVCAVDCGIAINPDQIRAQMEGGIGFGLGAVLKSELTLTNGKVDQGNFDGYEVLRINEMPQVEVHIVPSKAPPTGVGEPGVPPVGPAVANALAAANKKRIRVLPFSRGDIKPT